MISYHNQEYLYIQCLNSTHAISRHGLEVDGQSFKSTRFSPTFPVDSSRQHCGKNIDVTALICELLDAQRIALDTIRWIGTEQNKTTCSRMRSVLRRLWLTGRERGVESYRDSGIEKERGGRVGESEGGVEGGREGGRGERERGREGGREGERGRGREVGKERRTDRHTYILY